MAAVSIRDHVPSVIEDVKKLNKAFQGWESDKEPIIAVLAHRDTAQREPIKITYEEQYTKKVLKRIESKISAYCVWLLSLKDIIRRRHEEGIVDHCLAQALRFHDKIRRLCKIFLGRRPEIMLSMRCRTDIENVITVQHKVTCQQCLPSHNFEVQGYSVVLPEKFIADQYALL